MRARLSSSAVGANGLGRGSPAIIRVGLLLAGLLLRPASLLRVRDSLSGSRRHLPLTLRRLGGSRRLVLAASGTAAALATSGTLATAHDGGNGTLNHAGYFFA